jgi:hypothetical protein
MVEKENNGAIMGATRALGSLVRELYIKYYQAKW